MKQLFKAILILALFLNFTPQTESNKYKCLIQMKNYKGEKAYVITSLIDAKGKYVNTLHIHGDDDEWYHEISEWWKYFGKKKRNIDGISGATIGGGERNVFLFQIDSKYFNQGYKIRFESSVEDQEYHVKDLEIPFDSTMMQGKIEGSGYIRYVRIMAN
tara:strand:- start:4357 stop:4833 length:477 start_codon:yes stop_codon:yes gene_type:complete